MESKRLLKSEDKKISGVCGGIAEYYNLDPTIVRLATAALAIFSLGAGILIYLAAALIIPGK